MSRITVSPQEAGKVCPYCRFPLKEGALAERCDACGAIHHEECWRDGAGCAVLGCRNAGVAIGSPTAVGRSASASESFPGPAASIRPSWWNTKNVLLIMVAALVLAGGGVAAFIVSTRSNTKTESSAVPPATTVLVTETTPAIVHPNARARREERTARELVGIVVFSQRGRSAVQRGRYGDAIENRRETLVRLRALRGGSVRLRRAIGTFRSAIRASLQSDIAYAQGGDASESDRRATRLKSRFAYEFDAIANDYGLRTFNPDEI